MDRIPGNQLRWQSLDDTQLLMAVRVARMAFADDRALADQLDLAAEGLEFAVLRPTTIAELLKAQEADFHLVDELIREATERDPDFTELRVDPSRFSPYFLGGPLGDLEANIEARMTARRTVGTLLVELGHAASVSEPLR